MDYLQRDGVTKDGAAGRLFDAGGDEADGAAFAERCGEDRHHFRFIVAPEDADQLTDLKAFTRELMGQAEKDLGTGLDWVAVDHWNTGHPHIHILVRGQTDQGEDLVISRDYIGSGLRARASEFATLELGPRTELDIRRGLEAEVSATRWTGLDRGLARSANGEGEVDLRPVRGRVDPLRAYRVERMRTLERLGVAEPRGVGRWRMARDAEARLQALGERDDITARMHRAMRGARGADALDLAGDVRTGPIVGRLAARGLDDELKGSAFVVIDGVDGRLHHVRLGDLALATDAPLGAVVEARLADGLGSEREGRVARARVQLLVRADFDLQAQVGAEGATWLDRQLVARAPTPLAEGGFGAEVREAQAARTATLKAKGLAEMTPEGPAVCAEPPHHPARPRTGGDFGAARRRDRAGGANPRRGRQRHRRLSPAGDPGVRPVRYDRRWIGIQPGPLAPRTGVAVGPPSAGGDIGRRARGLESWPHPGTGPVIRGVPGQNTTVPPCSRRLASPS